MKSTRAGARGLGLVVSGSGRAVGRRWLPECETALKNLGKRELNIPGVRKVRGKNKNS